jgi:hypothetical protein
MDGAMQQAPQLIRHSATSQDDVFAGFIVNVLGLPRNGE